MSLDADGGTCSVARRGLAVAGTGVSDDGQARRLPAAERSPSPARASSPRRARSGPSAARRASPPPGRAGSVRTARRSPPAGPPRRRRLSSPSWRTTRCWPASCPPARAPLRCLPVGSPDASEVETRLKDLVAERGAERGWVVVALETMPDHVHLFLLFLRTDPTGAPTYVTSGLLLQTVRLERQRRLQRSREHPRARARGMGQDAWPSGE